MNATREFMTMEDAQISSSSSIIGLHAPKTDVIIEFPAMEDA